MNNYHRYIELPFTVPMPDQFNLPAKDFISYLLTFDPKSRPTSQEALQHKWLNQDNSD